MDQDNSQLDHTRAGEIYFIDLFLIVWKRKVMILAFTLLSTLFAAGVSIFLPDIYHAYAIFEPATDSNGKPVVDLQNLRDTINAGIYRSEIAKNLDLVPETVPNFTAVVPTNTSVIKITLESPAPETSVRILNEAIKVITADIREKADLQKEKIQDKIIDLQLEENRLHQQIELTSGFLVKVEKTISSLETEIKKDISNTSDRAIAVLLYANELQNQREIAYDMRKTLTDLTNSKEELIRKNENILRELERFGTTTIHIHPYVPTHPSKPKKLLIILAAGILSFFGSILLAFVFEFIKTVRHRHQFT